MKSSTNIVRLPHSSGHITDYNGSTRLLPRAVNWVVHLVRGTVSLWRSLFLHEATISDLQRLDNRMLRDIGIERDQIEIFVAIRLSSNSFQRHRPLAENRT